MGMPANASHGAPLRRRLCMMAITAKRQKTALNEMPDRMFEELAAMKRQPSLLKVDG
jgi:hypothetical protein